MIIEILNITTLALNMGIGFYVIQSNRKHMESVKKHDGELVTHRDSAKQHADSAESAAKLVLDTTKDLLLHNQSEVSGEPKVVSRAERYDQMRPSQAELDREAAQAKQQMTVNSRSFLGEIDSLKHTFNPKKV
jgi:hypothetical protein